MGYHGWSAIHGVMLIIVGLGVVGFHFKGLHEGPRVPLVCDRFSGARGYLFNELSMPSALILEVIIMVVCSTFMSHLPDEFLLSKPLM